MKSFIYDNRYNSTNKQTAGKTQYIRGKEDTI